MPVTGARGTGNVEARQLAIDMADSISLLEPDAAPLTTFVTAAKARRRKPTGNPKFEWFEDALKTRTDAVNNGAGYDDNDTSIVVDNGAYFQAQDLVRVPRTGEVFRVVTVAGNTLSVVVRGLNSTAAALVDNDELVIIGTAAEEGATSKAAYTANPTLKSNYTQIFRTPVEETGTMLHTATEHNPHDWDHARKKAGIEHMKDMEQSFFLGVPSIDTSGTHPRRTTGGVIHFANQNATAAGGELTEDEFFAALRGAFRYGSKTKTAFASPLAIDVLNSYPRGKLEVTQSEKTYGVSVMQYRTSRGVLNLVEDVLLEGPTYGGYIVIVDMNEVSYRYLANKNGSRDNQVLTNRQANDADTRKDEWLAECGLQFGQSKAHAVITGITS